MHGMPFITFLLFIVAAALATLLLLSMIASLLNRGKRFAAIDKIRSDFTPDKAFCNEVTNELPIPPRPVHKIDPSMAFSNRTKELDACLDLLNYQPNDFSKHKRWDLRLLSDAPSSEVKKIFNMISFDDALTLLLRFNQPKRSLILKKLELKTPFLRRLEESLNQDRNQPT